MTSNRRTRIRPVWVLALLLAILLIAAALAACNGESYGSDAPRDEPRSQKIESRNDDSVSAGHGDDTCGVRSDGSVACWGSDVEGQATPPAGSFDSVSTGSAHTCSLGLMWRRSELRRRDPTRRRKQYADRMSSPVHSPV